MVALPIAEAEASIKPIKIRLLEQVARYWINLHTLPENHPFWRLHQKINLNNTRFPSPLQLTAKALQEIDLTQIEKINPFCIAPWTPRVTVSIESHEEAIKLANQPRQPFERALFVDSSVRNSVVGVGIASSHTIYGVPHSIMNISKTIGRSDVLNAYYSELSAILEATKQTASLSSSPVHFIQEVSIYSDSQVALKVLRNPCQ